MSSAAEDPSFRRRTAVFAGAGAGVLLAAAALHAAFGPAAVGVLAGVLPMAALMLDDHLGRRDAARRRSAALAAAAAVAPAPPAATDALATLANRLRFGECLAQAIAHSRRHPGHAFAVMFLDFDRFKLINDTLGPEAGVRFLSLVARRIRAQTGPGDTVGWLGADEFAILVDDLGEPELLLAMADRLHRALAPPHALDGTELSGSASIGITVSSVGYEAPGDVLRDADVALARAKSAGRGCTALFDAGLQARPGSHLHLERDLRRALEQSTEARAEQLSLVFQPIFDLTDGQVVSFEALVRWQHPEHGQVPPDTFVPVAARSVLMDRLTGWVLARACAQLRIFQRGVAPGALRPRLHVNIACSDLARPGFVSQVATCLLVNGLDAAQLTLEIAEGSLLQHLAASRDGMCRLRDLGVRLAVDHFGAGDASLAQLSTLPVTVLKIDRGFVRRLAAPPDDADLVRRYITLGRSLGRAVIAEGIETPAQLDRLRELGCVLGQGYLLARPRRAPEHLLSCPWSSGGAVSTAAPKARMTPAFAED